jgi:hypothetical protein
MSKCQCLTLKGRRCSFNAKKGSKFCGKHLNCDRIVGQVTKKEVLKRARAPLTKIMEDKRRVGPNSRASKKKMLRDCGDECCADTTDDGLCHYAMCADDTCEPTCDVIYGTSVLARMNTNRAAGFAQNPRSRKQMMTIRDKVSKKFDQYDCSRKKR